MTTITSVATEIISTVSAGKAIYQAVVSAMDAIESVSSSMNGADKKATILSIIQDAVENAGQVWSTWATLVANFIDHVKGLYNAIVDLGASLKSTIASV